MLPYATITIFVILCSLVALPPPVVANVAGVDFGGEYFKIAIVKPGSPFEIVTNVNSKRKTETMVAFDGEERFFGSDALNVGIRRPHNAYKSINSKQFLFD